MAVDELDFVRDSATGRVTSSYLPLDENVHTAYWYDDAGRVAGYAVTIGTHLATRAPRPDCDGFAALSTNVYCTELEHDAAGRIVTAREVLPGTTNPAPSTPRTLPADVTLGYPFGDVDGALTEVSVNGSPAFAASYDANGTLVERSRTSAALMGGWQSLTDTVVDGQDRLRSFWINSAGDERFVTQGFTPDGRVSWRRSENQATCYHTDVLNALLTGTRFERLIEELPDACEIQ